MTTETGRSYEFGPFRLDPDARLLLRDDRPIPLTPKAFGALLLLVEGRGRLITKEDLMKVLWPDTFVTESNLTQTIFMLRKALGESGSDQRYILTAPGRGYRFAAEVREARNTPELSPRAPAAEGTRPGSLPSPPPASSRPWPVVLGIALGIVAVLGAFLPWSQSSDVSDVSEPETASMPLPLTSFPGVEAEAAWSPDGSQVAFMWDGENQEDYDIYLLHPGSSRTLRLTTEAGADGTPAWSPDGRWIAYVHAAADRRRYTLNLVSALGGPPQTLLTKSITLGSPSWTSDGRSLILEAGPAPGQPAELWAISLEPGEHHRLTSPPGDIVGDIGPAVSPDGGTVAFCRKTAWRTAELYLLDLRADLSPAGEPRRVTNLGYVDGPTWTPDGRRILFEASREGAGIWQLEVASGRVSPVHGAPDTASQPAVARRPTGHLSLIFTNQLTARSIWRYSTAGGPGGAPVELVPSSRSQTYPRYSNDGKRLAFSSTRTGHEEIWIAGADGSEAVQLTDLRHPLAEVGHWSTDDEMIAFVSQDRGSRQIYLIGSSGGRAVPITSEAGVYQGSGWSRDGRAYYYTSSRSGRMEVWKVPRGGGSPQQVTFNGGESAFESPLGILYYWRSNPGGDASLVRRMPDGDEDVGLVPAGVPPASVAPNGFYYRAAGTQDVYLYQENAGRSVRVLENVGQTFTQFTISPDGRWFAANFPRGSSVDLMIMEYLK